MIERAIHLLPGEPVPEAAGATRLLYGAEWCPHLLPRRREVEAARETAAGRGLSFTLVLPYLPPAWLDRAAAALESLRPGDEAVLNDWGALSLLRETPGISPVLGRLLVAGLASSGGAGGGALADESFNRFLADNGIGRAQVDAVTGLPGAACDRRLDWHRRPLVTLTRRCPWRCRDGRWETGACPRPCLGRRLLLERRDDGRTYPMDGCATFGLPVEAPADPRIERLVGRAGEEAG